MSEQQYRPLGPGEVIQAGDEISYTPAKFYWENVANSFIGALPGSYPTCQFRRPVQAQGEQWQCKHGRTVGGDYVCPDCGIEKAEALCKLPAQTGGTAAGQVQVSAGGELPIETLERMNDALHKRCEDLQRQLQEANEQLRGQNVNQIRLSLEVDALKAECQRKDEALRPFARSLDEDFKDEAVLHVCFNDPDEVSDYCAVGPTIGDMRKARAAIAGGQDKPPRPKVICICGSSRFVDVAAVKAWEFEKQGVLALSMHLLPQWYQGVKQDHQAEAEGVAKILDELHLRKIDMADEVFVVNCNGYIGERTSIEIAYAQKAGKPVKYLEALAGGKDFGQRRRGIYVASKVIHASIWRYVREDGLPIISTWIDEAGPGETKDYQDLIRRCFTEATSAELVLAYCEPSEIWKGALVEVGAALAAGVPVYCAGTCQNIPKLCREHPLWRQFDTLDEAIKAARAQVSSPAAVHSLDAARTPPSCKTESLSGENLACRQVNDRTNSMVEWHPTNRFTPSAL